MYYKRYIPVLLLILFLVIVQLTVTYYETEYFLIQLTVCAYYSLVVIGLCLLMGYAGQISIGHAAFFAIGGYTSGVLTTYNFNPHMNNLIIKILYKAGLLISQQNLYGVTILHFTPWLAFICAIIITILISFFIGIPVLKLKGHYLAMATLGFCSIIHTIFMGTRLFGEADGIGSVPAFTLIPGFEVNDVLSDRVQNYYIAWFFVIIGIILLLNLINSRIGRALRAIHGNEEAANAMGINTARFKLYMFVLSAVFAAVGGVFMTHYNGGIGPADAGIIRSIRYVAIVAVGGMANLWGTLIMGLILNYLSLRGYFGSYDDAVFGLILIVIMLFAPDGLLKPKIFKNIFSFIKKDKKVHM